MACLAGSGGIGDGRPLQNPRTKPLRAGEVANCSRNSRVPPETTARGHQVKVSTHRFLVKVAESTLQRGRGGVDWAGKRRGNRRIMRFGSGRIVLPPEALCDSESSRFGLVLEEAQRPVSNRRDRRGRNSDATYGGSIPTPEPAQTGNPQNRTMSREVARFGRFRAARINDSLVFSRWNRLLRALAGGPIQ